MDVQLPDGTVVKNVPDGTTRSQLMARIGKANPQAAAPAPVSRETISPAFDALRSIPGGLAKGASAVAGIPGDLERGVSWGTGTSDKGRFTFPSSGDIATTVAKPFGGYYVPQTTVGKYVETIASMAPAAASPGGAGARIARVVFPGAASEAAGQATEGWAVEPYARMIAALGSGVAVGGVQGALGERAAARAVPTSPQLGTQSQAAYGRMEQSGIKVKAQSFDRAINNITAGMAKEGINSRIPVDAQRRLFPKASAALETLNAAKGQRLSLSDIDTLRKTARIALESNDKTDRRLAHLVIDGLDDFVDGLRTRDVSGWRVNSATPQPQTAVADLNEARRLWTLKSKGEVIERAMEKANSTASGFENGLRIEFRKLANNERAMRQFTRAERAAIRTVERGTLSANILKELGKFSPVKGHLTRLLEMGGMLGAYSVAGPAGVAAGAGVAIGGEIARQGSIAATARSARMVDQAVRSGQPVAREIGGTAGRGALTSGALGRPELEGSYAGRLMGIARPETRR